MAAVTSGNDVIYGMQLPIQTLTRTLREDWEDDATVEDLVTVAKTAEATGQSFIGVCDHIAIPDDDYAKNMTTTWYDTVATLAYLAAHTTDVRLLSVVWIAAYRHPLATAKAFATIDHLSGGRAILGVGAGHVEGEFDALGVDFAARGAILNETIDAVRGAFADTYVSHHGDRYDYDDVGIGPQPVGGELPIWVGGNSKPAFRRVGERGDGWIPMGNPIDTYPDTIDYIRSHAEAAGRGDVHFDIGWMPPWMYIGDPYFEPNPYMLSGSAEEITQVLRDGVAKGANVLHLKFKNRSPAELSDQMEAFGRDIAPHLTA